MADIALPNQPASSIPSHPLRNRNFVMWWAGATISLLGDQFYIVALPWLVLQMTGSGVAMGTVLMAAGIPRAVLMLMGGAVTDRTSPRKILMGTGLARTLFVSAIGVLLWRNALHLWELYLLSFAFGAADAFTLPAVTTFLPSLVPSEQLPAANSVTQSSGLLAGIVGPAPAGFVMKVLGVAWAFFLDAISFLFILGALWKLPDPPRNQPGAVRPNMLRSIGEGFAYVGRDAALRSLMLLAAVLNFCTTGPAAVGLAYVAKKRFSSPSAYGIWISSVAAGMLLGMVLAGLRKSKRRGVLFLVTSIVIGLGIAGIGVMPGLWPVAALLVVMGGFNGFLAIQLQSWFQQRVDRAVLGRVMSVLMLSAYGLMPVSLAVAGAAVEWSTTWMFALAGFAVILVTAVGALQKPVRAIE